MVRLGSDALASAAAWPTDLILEPTPETVEATYQEIMLVVNQLVLPPAHS